MFDLIRSQKAFATVIAPYWPGQVWFQKLLTMVIDEPIRLPVSNRTVIAVGPKVEPFKNRAWACLETLWRSRLRCLGWTNHAATMTVNSLAESTLRTYNNYINKYVGFRIDQKVDFSNEAT